MAIQPETASVAKPSYLNGKQLAQHIFLETLAAIDVRHAMLSKIKRQGERLVAGDISIPLLRTPRVVAFGKAANRMAAILAEILGGEIEAGVSVAQSETAKKLENFQYVTGGHPYPDHGSLAGAQAALDLVSGLSENDLVLFLVSGGGSALFEMPLDPDVTLADLVELNRVLVTSDLRIEEINVLRKHLSAVKGGRLALRAWPARQLTIFISDVPEQYPSMVASGPTMPDESTAGEAFDIVERHKLLAKLPARMRKRFEARALEETPKPADEHFSKSDYFCVLSNRDALEAARASAEKLGFTCEIATEAVEGDYRSVAVANLAALDALTRAYRDRPVCLLAGGEVTCPVTGSGAGGRNQAYVLYAAQKIAGQMRVVLSAGTDGKDGNSPACGAVADGQTVSRARGRGLEPERYLAESDSYHFFCSLGDTLDTGFTDNNVRDVRLWMDFGQTS
jgi:glycerate 2-kinase